MKTVVLSLLLIYCAFLQAKAQHGDFAATVRLINQKIFQSDTALSNESVITGIEIKEDGTVTIRRDKDTLPSESFNVLRLAPVKSIFCESCGIEQVAYQINFILEIQEVIDEVDETGQIISLKKVASITSLRFKSVKDATTVAKAFIELQGLCHVGKSEW